MLKHCHNQDSAKYYNPSGSGPQSQVSDASGSASVVSDDGGYTAGTAGATDLPSVSASDALPPASDTGAPQSLGGSSVLSTGDTGPTQAAMEKRFNRRQAIPSDSLSLSQPVDPSVTGGAPIPSGVFSWCSHLSNSGMRMYSINQKENVDNAFANNGPTSANTFGAGAGVSASSSYGGFGSQSSDGAGLGASQGVASDTAVATPATTGSTS